MAIVCGVKKELLNTMGGWIITYSKKYFCHDGKDGSCFDKYCNLKEKQCQDTMEKMKKPMTKKKKMDKKKKGMKMKGRR